MPKLSNKKPIRKRKADVVAGIKMRKVSSSNLQSIGYDEDKKHLLVRFSSGSVWRYVDVTQRMYSSLVNAESIGRHFIQKIKGNKVGMEVPPSAY